jgi:hypothetical protein
LDDDQGDQNGREAREIHAHESILDDELEEAYPSKEEGALQESSSQLVECHHEHAESIHPVKGKLET